MHELPKSGPPWGLGGARIHPGAQGAQPRVELGAWAALTQVLLCPRAGR